MDGSLFDMQAYVIALLGLNLAVSVTTLTFSLVSAWRNRLGNKSEKKSSSPRVLTAANEFDAAKLRLSGPKPSGPTPSGPTPSGPTPLAEAPSAPDEHL